MKRILSALLLICSASAIADNLEDGQRALNAGNYKQAINDLNKYLDRNPQNAEALFNKGLALVMLEQDDEAIRVFSDLARDFPELPEPYNNLAVLYARAGRYEEARDALESALVTHPSYATAHENLGDIYAALANAAYNRAIVLDKGNGAIRDKQALVAQLINLESAALPPVQVAASQSAAAPQQSVRVPVTRTPVPKAPAVLPPANTAVSAAAATRPVAAPVAQAAAPQTQPAQAAAADSYDIPQTFSTEPVLESAPAQAAGRSVISAADKQALLARVEKWRATWSAKDPDGYLSNYSPNFAPATGVSRETWDSQRRTRVVRPRSILIQVLNPKVLSGSNGQAQVEFVQIYESNTYSDQVRKRLVMERVGGQWLIIKESVIG
ncbi:MAG: tetratricopeptide repeat protein [Oceanococcus sp.]